jgi:D-alanyl-D-alanine carboxypeptidase (penicillin-binding protein 5/6)
MFDYAFANYSVAPILSSGQSLEEKAAINGGKKEKIEVYPQREISIFSKRGEKPNVTLEKRLQNLKAPINKDDIVGELIVFKDGVEIDRVDLLAAEEVKAATFLDRLKKIARNWNG